MVVTPRATLRDAIFRSGRSQIEIARQVGIHESRLSKIVRGWLEANDEERQILARALRTTEDELFPPAERKPARRKTA